MNQEKTLKKHISRQTIVLNIVILILVTTAVVLSYLAGMRQQATSNILIPSTLPSFCQSSVDKCEGTVSNLENELAAAAEDPDFQEKRLEKKLPVCDDAEYKAAIGSKTTEGPISLVLHEYATTPNSMGSDNYYFVEVDDTNLPDGCSFPLDKFLTTAVLSKLKLKSTDLRDYSIVLTNSSFKKNTNLLILSHFSDGIFGIFFNDLSQVKTIAKPSIPGTEIFHLDGATTLFGITYEIEGAGNGCMNSKECLDSYANLRDSKIPSMWMYNQETEKSTRIYHE